jgi:hypothetical protein
MPSFLNGRLQNDCVVFSCLSLTVCCHCLSLIRFRDLGHAWPGQAVTIAHRLNQLVTQWCDRVSQMSQFNQRDSVPVSRHSCSESGPLTFLSMAIVTSRKNTRADLAQLVLKWPTLSPEAAAMQQLPCTRTAPGSSRRWQGIIGDVARWRAPLPSDYGAPPPMTARGGAVELGRQPSEARRGVAWKLEVAREAGMRAEWRTLAAERDTRVRAERLRHSTAQVSGTSRSTSIRTRRGRRTTTLEPSRLRQPSRLLPCARSSATLHCLRAPRRASSARGGA